MKKSYRLMDKIWEEHVKLPYGPKGNLELG